MRHYLATLHKRPDHHKKRFALVVSGSFTLLIFAIWILVNFGGPEPTPASANKSIEESSPIVSLMRGFGTGLQALFGGEGREAELEPVNNYGR